MPRYGTVDSNYGLRLRTAAGAADGPIYMLNLTKYRPEDDCRVGGDGHPTGVDAVGRYAPIPLLTAVGASLCLVADVLAGTGDWDRVAVVCYPTRRSFLALAARQDFQEWHANKQADVERTTVIGTLPLRNLPVQADPRRILLELWNGPVPHPIAGGPVTPFAVEGTVIGDGRRWNGARYTAIEPGTPLPLQPPRLDYLALLLEPRIVRWK